MNSNSFLFGGMGVLATVSFCATNIYAQKSIKSPNIIIVFADDLGYGDLGCYGQKLINTPNIDSLAMGGIMFTNYYAGCTVCAPSRETLLTGMHTGHTFIRGNFLTDELEDPAMPDDKITIAEYLKNKGYQTGLFGKWGLGGERSGPETQGFDSSYCYLDQIAAHNYYPTYLYENGKRINIDANKNKAKGAYSHNLIVEKTLNYIRESKKDQPFFLYLPYTLPHGEYTLPPEEPYLSKNWSPKFKVYASMISKLDKDVGRILQSLREKGIADNTIIFFSSDNGANMGFSNFFKSNGNLNGSKFGLNEGGIRVPLIVSWPGKIKPGQVSNHITASWDFLPTICQITGTKLLSKIDGISFLPMLFNKKQADHEYLYWEYYNYNYNWYEADNKLPRNFLQSMAIRYGKWKAIKNNLLNNIDSSVDLYDLEKDPGEKHNVANENHDIVKKINGFFKESSKSNTPYFPYAPDSLAKLHVFNVITPQQMQELFHYKEDRIPFVSSHRGGPMKGYPENCIATFEATLHQTWSIMEVDPHYTKDSAMVLMHDPTLDRTSTGHGKISDYTLAELNQLNLKDAIGDVTKWTIPTLDEALEWAKGKTILILDQKDVSAVELTKKIMEHHAEANAMIMADNLEDVKQCLNLDKNIMMQVFMPDRKSLDEFDKTGLPWKNIVAFVTHTEPKDSTIFNYIHSKGVLCIRGSSRTIDKQYTNDKISLKELINGYHKIIHSGADIIEADLGTEAGKTIEQLKSPNSSKEKYFTYSK